jgi:ribosome-associated heat shock protein Hsp15
MRGEPIKPSREVKPGERLEVRLGQHTITIIVMELNAQRRPAQENKLLYTETKDSCARREPLTEERHLFNVIAARV